MWRFENLKMKINEKFHPIQNQSSISLGERQEIEVFATQCPYKGGRAVFKARFYVHLFNDSIIYYDDELCLSQGIQRLKHEEGNQTVDFTLTPNPANEQVEVRILNHITDIVKIQLINPLGEILFENENKIGVNNCIINTKKYPSGFYQVKLYRNGEDSHTEKLILIK